MNKLEELKDDILYWLEDKYIDYIVRPKDSIKNFWTFRKEIWNFRPWDYVYLYTLMIKGMRELEHNIKTNDVLVRSQKTAKEIKRCRLALRRLRDDNYYSVKTTKFFKKYPLSWRTKKKDKNGLVYAKVSRNKQREKDFKELLALKDKARKDDWALFSRLFKRSNRWWD